MIGFAPIVQVTERMLASQLPDAHRAAFLEAMGDRLDRTRSGEPVFQAALYRAWLDSLA